MLLQNGQTGQLILLYSMSVCTCVEVRLSDRPTDCRIKLSLCPWKNETSGSFSLFFSPSLPSSSSFSALYCLCSSSSAKLDGPREIGTKVMGSGRQREILHIFNSLTQYWLRGWISRSRKMENKQLLDIFKRTADDKLWNRYLIAALLVL